MSINWAIGARNGRQPSVWEAIEAAYACRQAGDISRAREVVLAAISNVSNTEKAELIADLGRTDAQVRNYSSAIDCFRRALLLAPHHMHAKYALASLLAFTGKLDEADTLFRENIPVTAGNGDITTTATIRFSTPA